MSIRARARVVSYGPRSRVDPAQALEALASSEELLEAEGSAKAKGLYTPLLTDEAPRLRLHLRLHLRLNLHA